MLNDLSDGSSPDENAKVDGKDDDSVIIDGSDEDTQQPLISSAPQLTRESEIPDTVSNIKIFCYTDQEEASAVWNASAACSTNDNLANIDKVACSANDNLENTDHKAHMAIDSVENTDRVAGSANDSSENIDISVNFEDSNEKQDGLWELYSSDEWKCKECKGEKCAKCKIRAKCHDSYKRQKYNLKECYIPLNRIDRVCWKCIESGKKNPDKKFASKRSKHSEMLFHDLAEHLKQQGFKGVHMTSDGRVSYDTLIQNASPEAAAFSQFNDIYPAHQGNKTIRVKSEPDTGNDKGTDDIVIIESPLDRSFVSGSCESSTVLDLLLTNSVTIASDTKKS